MKKFILKSFFALGLLLGTTLSAQIKTDDKDLVVFPNPAKDYVLVKSKDANKEIKNIAVYSLIGSQVMDIELDAISSEIRLDRLKPGKYLIRFTMADDSQLIRQLIKQ
jgi:Secretion system C-terminal sorting domain